MLRERGAVGQLCLAGPLGPNGPEGVFGWMGGQRLIWSDFDTLASEYRLYRSLDDTLSYDLLESYSPSTKDHYDLGLSHEFFLIRT